VKKSLLIALLILSVFFWSSSKIDLNRVPIEGCPFCQKSILDRQLVYRGQHASVLATHKPAVPGHLLIIPNRHVETFDLLDKEEIGEIGDLVKRVHALYIHQFDTTQYLLIQKNGRLAGQTVPHVHLHVLPRTENMSQLSFLFHFFLSPWLKSLNDQEMKESILNLEWDKSTLLHTQVDY